MEWLAQKILPTSISEYLEKIEANNWLDSFDSVIFGTTLLTLKGQIRMFHLLRAVLSSPARSDIQEGEDHFIQLKSIETKFLQVLQSVPGI